MHLRNPVNGKLGQHCIKAGKMAQRERSLLQPPKNTAASSRCPCLTWSCSLSTESEDKQPAGLPQQGADRSPNLSPSLRCHNARPCTPMTLRTQTNSASMPMTLLILLKKVSVRLAVKASQGTRRELLRRELFMGSLIRSV